MNQNKRSEFFSRYISDNSIDSSNTNMKDGNGSDHVEPECNFAQIVKDQKVASSKKKKLIIRLNLDSKKNLKDDENVDIIY